jgi:hypothetical protein
MRREDEAKTGFTTPFGIFCFVRMPEGLRNAGSTFNRMMKLILATSWGATPWLMLTTSSL